MVEDRKVYTSFHDIPPRDYMYFPKGSLDAGKPGKFSRVEINHLLISMAVLTVVFAFIITQNNLFWGLIKGGFNFNVLSFGLGMAFLGVLTAFFFHEIAHKLMAQKYGLWAEYRMFPKGLRLALLLGVFTPIVFAAPGAVMFRGQVRAFEMGKIAVAGPLANIIIAMITLPLYLFVFFEDILLGRIVLFICFINALLATFNLLPLGPFDGAKVVRWNATVWIILFIIAVGFMMAIFPYALVLQSGV